MGCMKFPVLWLLVLTAQALLAQQSPGDKTAGTSTVSGHVYCADTNAPARMATVMLEPVNLGDTRPADSHGPVATYVSAVQTLLDGSFSIHHVAPGKYYVIASAPGYVSPLAALGVSAADMRKPDDALREKIARVVPQVTVQANLPVSIDVTVERGAAVSGTILYDDGSPAAGLEVRLLIREKGKWVPVQSGPFDMASQVGTDDRGAYRISGLPAREYLLEADLRLTKRIYEFDGHGGTGMSFEPGYSLPVYSGNHWRPNDAAPFSLKQGEERAGEDIEIPVSKLHSVRGTIIAARDGHVVNGGRVALLHADDKSEATTANLAKDETGFTFSFVPEGDYILRVTSASDVEYKEIANPPLSVPPTRTETHVLHSYGPADQALHVEGDVSGLTVAVPERGSEKAQANP